MPDYKKLYHKTFNALTDADRLIQQACVIIKMAQQDCENIFVETDENYVLLSPDKNKFILP